MEEVGNYQNFTIMKMYEDLNSHKWAALIHISYIYMVLLLSVRLAKIC